MKTDPAITRIAAESRAREYRGTSVQAADVDLRVELERIDAYTEGARQYDATEPGFITLAIDGATDVLYFERERVSDATDRSAAMFAVRDTRAIRTLAGILTELADRADRLELLAGLPSQRVR